MRFGGPGKATTYWVGAGPTGGTGGGSHTAFSQFSPGSTREWGWDVNAGVAFSGSMRSYLMGRYNAVGDVKTAGVAVGLRFGR